MKIVYCCFSLKDSKLWDIFREHLKPLERGGCMHLFHDLGIQAGNNLQQERDYYTKTADIILLLLSRHFISDNDSYDILQKAVTRFKSNEASVFQIILTPIYVECLPNIVQLPKLPKNPTSQQTRDQRFKKVAEELHKLLEDKQ